MEVKSGSNPSAKADCRFKILYAFGMIFIVAGHCKNGGLSLGYEWFSPYAFHLGLFAFSSGYFYKKEAEENIGAYVIKKGKHLIVPLYLWNLFYGILVTVLAQFGFTIGGELSLENLLIMPVINGHQYWYNLGGWFVVPLFLVQLQNVLVHRLLSKIVPVFNEWCFFLLALCEGMAGVYLASIGYNTGGWLVLVRTLYFVPFYEAGILYKRQLEKKERLSSFWYFSVIFTVQLIIILIYGKAPYYTPSWCNDFTDGPVLPFIVGFLGIAFWLRIAKLLEPVIGNSRYIHLIADNTYSIMINQFLGFMAVKALLAFAAQVTPWCSGFDMGAFQNSIWYFYLPGNVNQFRIVYVAAGIAVPIVMQTAVNRWKKRVEKCGIRNPLSGKKIKLK